jgi:hypothetical protein
MPSLSRLSHTAIAATWRGGLVLDTVLSKTCTVSDLTYSVYIPTTAVNGVEKRSWAMIANNNKFLLASGSPGVD